MDLGNVSVTTDPVTAATAASSAAVSSKDPANENDTETEIEVVSKSEVCTVGPNFLNKIFQNVIF